MRPVSETGDIPPAALPDAHECWDEYQWEAYLRRQDACAEEYLALLEYYGDEPDAHNVIARCMGWTGLLTGCAESPQPPRCDVCTPSARQDCRFYRAYLADTEPAGDGWLAPADRPDGPGDEARWDLRYGQHVIHVQAQMLLLHLRSAWERLPGRPAPAGPLGGLVRQVHACVGRIATALKGYCEPARRGQVIAYLKMAFHATSLALGQVRPAQQAGQLSPRAADGLTVLLLAMRDQLAELIADFRRQIRRP